MCLRLQIPDDIRELQEIDDGLGFCFQQAINKNKVDERDTDSKYALQNGIIGIIFESSGLT